MPAENPIDKKLDKALDKANTTADFVQSYGDAIDAWQDELSKNLKSLSGKLSPEAKDALTEAEKKWSEYKKAELEFSAKFFEIDMPGTMYIPSQCSDELNLIRDRALELKGKENMIEFGEESPESSK